MNITSSIFLSAVEHEVDGKNLGESKQLALLRHAIACCSREQDREARIWPGGDQMLTPDSRHHLCAVGDGARHLCKNLRSNAIEHLKAADRVRHNAGGFSWGAPSNILVLVAPELPPAYFDRQLGPYSEGALIQNLFQRIVVLHCPRDRRLAPGIDMGRVGPTGELPAHLTAIDVTRLLEFSQDAIYGAFCSCECLFLIAQLLLGVAPDAARPPALKS